MSHHTTSNYFRASVGGGYAGRFFIGISAASAIFSAWSYFQSYRAQKEIEFRKEQLRRPVYRLSEEEHVNPPWNHDNLDDWLYRRVEVIGRPIHSKSMQIPCRYFEQLGVWNVVPLVCREDKKYEHRKGLLFSMGFIPQKVAHPTCRFRVERVDRQKFTCFVGKLVEFQNDTLFTGNAYGKGRLQYHNSDLNDMAISSELENRQQASVAVLQHLQETGVLDERSPKRVGCDAMQTEEFPYPKTESGALQLAKMPWDYKSDAKHFFIGSLASLLVGASIF